MSTAAESRQRVPLPAPTDGPSSAGTSSAAGPASRVSSHHRRQSNASATQHYAGSRTRQSRPDDAITDLSRRSDRTSYSVPSDGSPVTIPVPNAGSAVSSEHRHGRQQSRTNLLIEYFEGSSSQDGRRRKPSVRVRVTPNTHRSTVSQAKSEFHPPTTQRESSTVSHAVTEGGMPTYTRGMPISHRDRPRAQIQPDSDDESVDEEPLSGANLGNLQQNDLMERGNESDLDANDDEIGSHMNPMVASQISTMPPDSLLLAAEKSTIIGSSRLAAPAPYMNPENAQSYERLKQKVVERLISERRNARAKGLESSSKTGKAVYQDNGVDVYNARREASDEEQLEEDEEEEEEHGARTGHGRGPDYRRSSSPLSGVSLRSSPQVLDHLSQTISDVLLPEIRSIRAQSQRKTNRYDDSKSAAASGPSISQSKSPQVVPLTHHALETFNSHSSLQEEAQAQRERRKRRATIRSSPRVAQETRDGPSETLPLQSLAPTDLTRESLKSSTGSPAMTTPTPARTREVEQRPGSVPSPLARPLSRQAATRADRTPKMSNYYGYEEPAHAQPADSMRSPLILPSEGVNRHSYSSGHDNQATSSPHGSARARAAMYETLSTHSSPGKGMPEETEAFFRHAHEENERYRHSDHYTPTRPGAREVQTRWSPVKQPNAVQTVLASNPNVQQSPAVESAVASLIDPSSSGAGSAVDRDRGVDRADGLGLSPIPEYGMSHAHVSPSQQASQFSHRTRPESPLFAQSRPTESIRSSLPVNPALTTGVDRSADDSPARLHTGYSLRASAIPGPADAVFPEMGYGVEGSISDVRSSTKPPANAGPPSLDRDEGFVDGDRFTPEYGQAADSPLYNAATGQNLDKIKSKDIVALMDHLTVRDAQRNARDTEILVTLVRSAAEMRNQFEEMKHFIHEQDLKLMRSTDASVQQILRGPRPPPASFAGRGKFIRGSETEDEPKKPNVLRRALKGLSLSRTHDIGKMEEMLMQLLDDVEELKHGQGMMLLGPAPAEGGYESRPAYGSGLTSYEQLRAREDPLKAAAESAIAKYNRPDLEERAPPTSSSGSKGTTRPSPLQSHPAHVFVSPRSGSAGQRTPDSGRAGSQNTIRGSPGRQVHQASPSEKRASLAPSMGAVSMGAPRVSRWSKTTASTALPDSSPRSERPTSGRPGSTASTVASAASAASAALAARALGARAGTASPAPGVRPPSPLIPDSGSAVSTGSQVRIEDPHFRSQRNSLTLEHPKPRPGPTDVHRQTLESAAHEFDHAALGVPGSELSWASQSSMARDVSAAQLGSMPALARNLAPKFAGSGGPSSVPSSGPSGVKASPKTSTEGQPPYAGGWYAYDSPQNSAHEMYGQDQFVDNSFSGQIVTLNTLPPAVNTLESHMPRPPLEAIEEIQSVRYSVDENGSSLVSALNRNSVADRHARPLSVASSVSSAQTVSAVQENGDLSRRYSGPTTGRGVPRRKEYSAAPSSSRAADSRGYLHGATPTPSETAAATGYNPGSRNTSSQYDDDSHVSLDPQAASARYSGVESLVPGPYDGMSAHSGLSDRSAPRWVHGVTDEEWNDLSSYRSTPAPSETF